ALTFEFYVEPPPRCARPNIGLVAQSGAMAAIMRMAFLAKGLGISFYISTGNEADLTAEDFLAGLIDDENTQVAALFVEQIRKPQKFLELAERARAVCKPIVLMHAGRSQRARTSASSHTGALTGDHAVATALLRHAAVAVVDTLEELVDCADVLARCKPPVKGPGIITNSGAVKGFALDFCDQIGFEVPRLAPATIERLKTVLPAFASLDNPLDITAMVLRDVSLWPRTAEALLADPGIGSLGLPVVAGKLQYAMGKFDALRPTLRAGGTAARDGLLRDDFPVLRAGGAPALVGLRGDDFPVRPEFVAAFRAEGVPVLRSTERALRALGHETVYGAALASSAGDAATIEAPPLPRRGALPEYEGKAYLAALGIPIPDGALARTVAEAKAMAQRIGYPVALKAQSAALAHKSDAGGVALNIADAQALEAAWTRMMDRVTGAQS